MKKRAAESVVDVLKKVRILLVSESCELTGSLFANGGVGVPRAGEIPAKTEALLEGKYHDDGTRVALSYVEAEGSGMEDTRVTLSFQKEQPHVVTMLRTGSVKTSIVFEAGSRHECVYQTPFSPFDVCVQTEKLQNGIVGTGVLSLDYVVELKGAQPERRKMTVTLLPIAAKG